MLSTLKAFVPTWAPGKSPRSRGHKQLRLCWLLTLEIWLGGKLDLRIRIYSVSICRWCTLSSWMCSTVLPPLCRLMLPGALPFPSEKIALNGQRWGGALCLLRRCLLGEELPTERNTFIFADWSRSNRIGVWKGTKALRSLSWRAYFEETSAPWPGPKCGEETLTVERHCWKSVLVSLSDYPHFRDEETKAELGVL